MEIQINSRYKELEHFVKNIPNTFNDISEIVQNRRNDIRICTVGNYKLVVKSFKGMYLPNQIAYSLFRKSKAQRSYEISFQLQSLGFTVPEPVGFIDCYTNGLLSQSYFISLYYDHIHFNKMAENKAIQNEFLHAFAEFTSSLHRAGVYHGDYSNGNILCNKTESGYAFALVDLNRIKFFQVDFKQGIRNLAKLWLSKESLKLLVKYYVELNATFVENAIGEIIKMKNRRSIFSVWRKRAKAIFFPGRIQRELQPIALLFLTELQEVFDLL